MAYAVKKIKIIHYSYVYYDADCVIRSRCFSNYKKY